MNENGVLVVVSGLSGAGKGTICRRILEKYPDEYVLSISATSRKPRKGETDGKEYFFKSREEFEKMIADGLFLEHTEYIGNYYGTPKEWVETQMKSGKNVILEIEMNGGLQVREKLPDSAVLVFILPPDMNELESRLRGRATETEEQIQKRLAHALKELEYVKKYDHTIVNEIVENSVDMLHNIVSAERTKQK